MARIWGVVADGGAANSWMLVADQLQKNGHGVKSFAQRGLKAEGKDLPNKLVIDDSAEVIEELFETYPPDVVVAGVSGNQIDITVSIASKAMSLGIPVVKVSDFWGTGFPYEKGLAVTKSCVLDAGIVDYEAEMRSMSKEDIVATGSPVFDNLSEISPIPALPDDMILFVGPSSEVRVREIFVPFIEALVKWKSNAKLGVLWHPKSNPETYAPEMLTLLYPHPDIHVIGDEQLRSLCGKELDRVLASARMVVGATSTELVKACYMRKPTLSIVPEGGENHKILTSRGIEIMPTSDVYATDHSDGEVGDIFASLVNLSQPDWSQSQMYKKQCSHYYSDGLNTTRVVEVIESVL